MGVVACVRRTKILTRSFLGVALTVTLEFVHFLGGPHRSTSRCAATRVRSLLGVQLARARSLTVGGLEDVVKEEFWHFCV